MNGRPIFSVVDAHINVGEEDDVSGKIEETPLFISTPSCLSSQTYQNQGATSLCMLRQAIGGEEKQERYMKLNSAAMAADQSNKRSNRVSCRRLGGYLRQQKGRLYIIRRCVVMLLCWHD
ncbi:hypothetical protein GBA52_011486 [Prunus armeniaca]|nr:hypothetical protein GBA52_011486 [Prunus armeniaca]